MIMTPRLRKAALTAHIVSSVGWLGAIVPYLALAIAGLTGSDAQMGRAAFLSMEVIGWYVIVPFSLAALLTGLVQALGTQWGLFRHWWILAKFALTIVAVAVLLRHMQDVSRVAQLVRETLLSTADFRPELIHAAGGLLIVLVATMLSVFKPWGMTPYGLSKAKQMKLPSRSDGTVVEVREPAFAVSRTRWGRIIGFHAVGLALLAVIILHLTGGGFRHH
jgi:hypothetical protein